MPHQRPPLSQEDAGKLIALGAVLIGAFVYLYPPWLAGFPINDGGLFYSMIRAIQTQWFSTAHQRGLQRAEHSICLPTTGSVSGSGTQQRPAARSNHDPAVGARIRRDHYKHHLLGARGPPA